jgi:hypothetical protein
MIDTDPMGDGRRIREQANRAIREHEERVRGLAAGLPGGQYDPDKEALAAEVRRLRAELDRARPVIDAANSLYDYRDPYSTEDSLDELRAAVRAYRETRP